IWNVATAAGSLCLRAWPADVTAARLASIHAAMRLARGLDFVPRVFATHTGTTWLEYGGRLFDLTTRMPGQADFERAPTRTRLEQACLALARLHQVWKPDRIAGPSGAIERRLRHWQRWRQLTAWGWRACIPSLP